MRTCSLLAALTLVAGCSSSKESAPVALGAPVFVTGASDTVRMAEVLRIGSLDGAEEYQFARVDWMMPTPDGGVILYDNGPDDAGNAIRQFDSRGKFVRRIGRQGEGPGEYGAFPMATKLTDGSLLIADQSLARITRFDTGGALAQTVRGPSGIVDLFPASGGGWWVEFVSGPTTGLPRPITYYQYSASGTVVESLPAAPAYRDGPFGAPHEPRAMTIILPDGRLVSSRTDSIGFTVDGPGGSSHYGHASDRPRFDEREKASLLRRYESLARRGGHRPEAMQIPDLKPAYWYLVSDPAGRIIFLRNTTSYLVADTASLRPGSSPWRGTLQLDVFDSSTAYVGRLVSPRDVARGGAAFARDAIWLIHEGPDGEEYVVKWKPERQVW